ncbi:MAG: hypothetical protein ABIO55_07225 [Ginsengibacter sp.]
MADVPAKEIRSKNIAAIERRNTKPEMLRSFYTPINFVISCMIKARPERLVLFAKI